MTDSLDVKVMLVNEVGQDRAFGKDVLGGQMLRLARRLEESVARSSKPADVAKGLQDALRLLSQVQEQTNPLAMSDGDYRQQLVDEKKRRGHELPQPSDVWAHRDIYLAFSEGDKYKRSHAIEQDELGSSVFTYLRQPWSDCVELERLMLDALVFAEVDGFGVSVKGRGLGINASWKWQAFRQFRRWSWLLLISGVCGVGLGERWGLWPGIITFVVVYQLTSIAYSTSERTLNAERVRIFNLLLDMQAFYASLWRPDLCPAALWEMYSGMVSKGATFHPAVPALIQHAVRRNPVIWSET